MKAYRLVSKIYGVLAILLMVYMLVGDSNLQVTTSDWIENGLIALLSVRLLLEGIEQNWMRHPAWKGLFVIGLVGVLGIEGLMNFDGFSTDFVLGFFWILPVFIFYYFDVFVIPSWEPQRPDEFL